ncbi:MAG: hypothetical protein COT88_00095 [Candidatus Colwellbacteria bacterium CG10_big_fil_rev_8_21_14_0_10_41_28]|uniref:Peptidase M16 n=1 Tax=Candidatus Colwellbacteria bacterium CG10_big_fil_rev_8_21_14_0_10_41_28 TaxID=1974539 RepID=A0A2H0VHX9_9BACT|nr:MAG: hypothetical protein COT88_00095 [Candidatus Colwellbacteria bacterium CG10_big_fil_rev_8_21_14_0_10_41_28]
MELKKKVLNNGIRAVVVPQKDNPAVTVLVLVETGSKYETKDISGISHFLEHMCFKGTKNRPTPLDISGELDRLGSSYNAFTGHEYTGYYAKVDKGHFEKALDIVSDIYLNQIFDEEEIEREKGVIIEEINMYEDIPQRKVVDDLTSLLYGDQPAGWNIGGDKDVIKKITKDDFLAYKKDHYVPNATTVVVAGSVDPEDALEKIEKIFSSMEEGDKKDKLPVKEEQSKPEMHMQKKDSEQTHLILAVRAYDTFHKDRFVVRLIGDILGGGMSSRLWAKVRGELGAAYYVGADSDEFTDTGVLSARAGVEHSKLEVVISAILAEFKRLKEELVSEEELQKTKDHMIGSMMLGLETSNSVAMYYGFQELIKKEMKDPNEVADMLRAITQKDIQRVAKDIFKNEKLNLALIGPVEEMGMLETLLKID